MRKAKGSISMRGIPGSLLIAVALLCAALPSRAQKEKDRSAEPGSFSFITITDTHQTADGSTEPLRALVSEATNAPQRPAFIIHTGDVTESGKQAEYDRFKQAVAPLDRAGIKFYAVPGHHDVRWSTDGKETFARAFGKLYQSFD